MTSVRQRRARERAADTAATGKPAPPPTTTKRGPGQEPTRLGRSRLAQVRLHDDEMQAVEDVMRVLDLPSTSEALRAGLKLLAREAAEVDAAENIRAFYEGQPAPLPDGVVEPRDCELTATDDMQW